MATVEASVWYANYDFYMAAGTVALAVITAVLAYYTYRLFQATVAMSKAAAEGAVQQAKDTQEALAISARSAEAAVAAQRAWLKVSVEQSEAVQSCGDGQEQVRVKVTVENIGNSPANGIQFSMRACPMRAGDMLDEPMGKLLAVARNFTSSSREGAATSMADALYPGSKFTSDGRISWDSLPDGEAIGHLLVVRIAYSYVGGTGFVESPYILWLKRPETPIYPRALEPLPYRLHLG